MSLDARIGSDLGQDGAEEEGPAEDEAEGEAAPRSEANTVETQRTMSFRLAKGSTFRLSKTARPTLIAKGSSFKSLTELNSFDEASQAEIARPVKNALVAADKRASVKMIEEQKMRKMMHSTTMGVNIRVTVHGEREHPRCYMMEVVESIRFQELTKAIEALIGGALGDRKLFGIDKDGEVADLINGETFSLHTSNAWCSQPWDIHVSKERGPLQTEQTAPMARFLFETYDVNCNGRIERAELLRLLKDLQLEELDVSEQLIERFVDGELARLARLPGGDGRDGRDGGSPPSRQSNAVRLPQFVQYVGEMVRWMRQELLADFHTRNVHALLAARATEAVYPATLVPVAVDDGSGRGRISRLDTGKLGVQVEIPHGALGEDDEQDGSGGRCKIALKTFTASSVAYLLEGREADQKRKQQQGGESPSQAANSRKAGYRSPIVQVDYPADDDEDDGDIGGSPMSMRSASSARRPFAKPLTLILPHCFEPASAGHTCVVLGAPLGSEKWEPLDLVRDAASLERAASRGQVACRFEADRMRVEVPFPGIFCAMTDPSVDEVAAVRLHVFASQQVIRDTPATLRLHVCPMLPAMEHELELVESSEWGLSHRVALSKVLYLWQGARLELTYLEQVATLTWHGMRTKRDFTVPPSRMARGTSGGGHAVAAHLAIDKEGGAVLNDSITIKVVEGEGKKGSNVAMVAKRAGIPLTGLELPLCMRLQEAARPPQPELALTERTQQHFAVQWVGGVSSGGGGRGEVTHFALELAAAKPDGTYMAWDVLWIGAGHASPDFAARVAGRMMKKDVSAEAVRKLKDQKARRLGKGDSEVKWETFTYVLEVDPNLSGKLRLRSWAKDEARPSPYSDEVLLPRFKGKGDVGVGAAEKMVRTERRTYFASMRQHVTDGGNPSLHRIGNAAGSGAWGGDAIPPPPPLTAKEKSLGHVRAPIPFDVPRLPPQTPGLQEAGATLARLYRAMGVAGGGGGLLCGLRIDSILHAVVGTPTTCGKAAPKRTCATLRQPMIALCEVFYFDVLRPLLDQVAVLKDEWCFVDEKLRGIVAQLATLRKHYHVCEPHLITIVRCLFEIGETMRQCQDGHILATHIKHPDYTKAAKRGLKEELALRICDLLWRLSTDLLQMQINVGKPLTAAQLAAGACIANAAAARFKRRKVRRLWLAAYKRQVLHLPGAAARRARLRTSEELLKMMAEQAAPPKSTVADEATELPTPAETAEAGTVAAAHVAAATEEAMLREEAEDWAKRKAAAEREAAEKAIAVAAAEEKRLEQIMQHAAARIFRQQLARGWASWLAAYGEERHQQQLFLLVGSRLSRPKLSACYAHWRRDWLDRLAAERAAAAAAAAKAAAKRAAAEAAAAAAAERQRRQVLTRLYRMHSVEFPPPGPNAARAARLVANLEARLDSPALRHKARRWGTPPDIDWVQPHVPHSPRVRSPSPPSLAIAIGPPSLYSEYERRVQEDIDADLADVVAPSTATATQDHTEGPSALVASSTRSSQRERPVSARPAGLVSPPMPKRPLTAQPAMRYQPKVRFENTRASPLLVELGSARAAPAHRKAPSAPTSTGRMSQHKLLTHGCAV